MFDIGGQKSLKRKLQIPIETHQIIKEHGDAVSFCQFSPDGTKLAIGSIDRTVSIYDVDPERLTVEQSKIFGHPFEINFFSWSPNSELLMTCGLGRYPDLWVWNVSDEILKLKLPQDKDLITSCCWFDGGESFVVGRTRGQCYQYDLNGTLLKSLQSNEVISLLCRSDGKSVLAADVYGQIRSVDFNKGRVEHSIQEFDTILSLTLNKTDNLVLVHTLAQGISLWDLQRWSCVKRFQGITERLFNSTTRSSFGGIQHEFFASGSKDNNVYLWQIKHKKPLAKLTGHTNTVNCVSWNPVYHQMLVSVSDDCTARLWVPASSFRNQKAYDDVGEVLEVKSKGLWSKVRDAIKNAFKKKKTQDNIPNIVFEEICFDKYQDSEKMQSLTNKAEQFDEAGPSKVDSESDQNWVLYENEEELEDNSEGQTMKYFSTATNDIRDNPTNVQSQEDIDGQFSGDQENQGNHPVFLLLQKKKEEKSLDIHMTQFQKQKNINKSTSDNVSESTSNASLKSNCSV